MDIPKSTSAAQLAIENVQPGEHHVLWMTLAVKNGAATLLKAPEMHAQYIVHGRGPGRRKSLARLPAANGREHGGGGDNAMGFAKKVTDNSQLILLSNLTYCEEQSRSWFAELETCTQ
ncbi:hypothetical protein PG993_003265 [Apiospora rasikravindrae]|uniref:Uncharacterized protein n=1 Tax=Apiospora rasikravindrae TaxID=990691 RepID=A0ABR1TZ28_9PEZI